MSNEMDELYLVQDGVDDVTANDHNTVIEALQFLYKQLGGRINHKNGEDGHLQLGVITATTTTAPTVTATVAGNVSGTFYYKYAAYNLSGETAASSAAAAITCTSKQPKIVIPGTSSASKITGFYIYRSTDGSTYYRIGKIASPDATQGATFYDNVGITLTSGTSPQGSNNTAVTASAKGFFSATALTVANGETLTVSDSPTGLVVFTQGDITVASGATVTSTGANTNVHPVITKVNAPTSAAVLSQIGTLSTATTSLNTAAALYPNDDAVKANVFKFYNCAGGTGSTTLSSITVLGGAGYIFASATRVIINGTVTSNGDSGASAGVTGGAAGGTIVFVAPVIDRSSAVINAIGGNGGGATATADGPGGGGGGVVAFFSDYLAGTATITVDGGATGSDLGATLAYGGGANGGASEGASSGVGGSVGRIVTAALKDVRLAV